MASKEILLNNEWIDAFAEIGIDNRYELNIQNKSNGLIRLWVNGAHPTNLTDGYILQSAEEQTFRTQSEHFFINGYGRINIIYNLDNSVNLGDVIQVSDDAVLAKLEELRLTFVTILSSAENIEAITEGSKLLIEALTTYVDQVEALLQGLGNSTEDITNILTQLGLNTDEVEDLLRKANLKLEAIQASIASVDSKTPNLIDNKVPVTGPLTNAELRLSPIGVSGTVGLDTSTIDALRPNTEGLTDAELRAAPVPITGEVTLPTGIIEALQQIANFPIEYPLPDPQFQALVPQKNALTNAELRAAPVPVSGTVELSPSNITELKQISNFPTVFPLPADQLAALTPMDQALTNDQLRAVPITVTADKSNLSAIYKRPHSLTAFQILPDRPTRLFASIYNASNVVPVRIALHNTITMDHFTLVIDPLSYYEVIEQYSGPIMGLSEANVDFIFATEVYK